MADLAAGVDSGVGPAGDDQSKRMIDAEHPREPQLELALDGAVTGLGRPAGEIGAAVADVEPPAFGRIGLQRHDHEVRR
ncbi:hypothetical protein GCM10027613_10210 [Microlunatus endophyticus]